MKGIIYKITNKVNNKSYIGQTRYTLEFRWRQHLNSKDNCYFHKAIKKYGSENFSVEVLEECDFKDLDSREIYYIAKYDTFKNGYNSTIGGDGVRTLILDDKYDEIKRLYLSGFSSNKIATLYNVDKASIVKILKSLDVKLRNNKISINKQEFEELVKDYNTGYSFVWNPGTLAISGGISIGLNHAVYDNDNFIPYEVLIKKYNDKWQFSNQLSFSLSWDGRDLKTNTTRGYILSLDFTYAGGFMQGLSNYNRFGFSGSAYHSLFKYENEDGEVKNLVLSGTSSLSLMLPQYWNDEADGGWGWHAPQRGATKYEMLYIDGMNIGRGFNVVYDQSFLWHNQAELSFPLVDQVLALEAFASATGVAQNLSDLSAFSDINWYIAAGAGIKMQIPGFPLGLYLVKNATINATNGFAWDSGFIFHSNDKPGSGFKLVLAITTSLF